MTQPPASPREDAPPHRYTAALADRIERAWQERWSVQGTYRQPNPGEPGFDPARPKFYCLDMFPYPSGAGLHVGHPEGYTGTDIVCRFRRMRGYNVLHPMGWDAFGLPAEQYAIQTGVHPALTTRKSIDTFRRQLQRFGFSYDWSREFGTIDPEYYRWTQWIFLRLYDAWFDPRRHAAAPIADLVTHLELGEIRPQVNPDAEEAQPLSPAPTSWHECSPDQRRAIVDSYRLAYQGTTMVNWCPRLGTVLANDEVIDGRSERGGHPVLRKPLKQWMFRITACAQRLLDQLAFLDWPESTRTMQREWIGRSEGAEVEFALATYAGGEATRTLRVFTTRPDTLFGATYMVVAPEHPLVEAVLAAPGARTDAGAVRDYARRARNRSDVERMESKDKTGVDLGIDAINPATGRPIPVWAADYVLMGYGTGAIMAVPAHDQRDFDFAAQFKLPIRDVVYSKTHLAMRHFALHAAPEERADEHWAGVLADLLGWTTSGPADDFDFDAALRAVRTRRAGTPAPEAAPTRADASPGSLGERRGVTASIWRDALDDLKLRGFDDLRDRFQRCAFHAESGGAFEAAGHLANSANAEVSLDTLGVEEARRRMIEWLEMKGAGTRQVNFRLRDWTFSRQRYWGEPFPIVFDAQGRHYPVGEHALPVRLPELADYAPVESDDPQPLLAKAGAWVRTTAGAAGVDPALLPPDTPVTRECNTMPGSAGSSWYFLRYCDAHHAAAPLSPAADAYWMGPVAGTPRSVEDVLRAPGWGVDLYLGGSEHAVGHLLYARFWQNVMFDLGLTSTPEPFRKLFHQGLITSFAYQRPDKTLVPGDEVEERAEGEFFERATGTRLTSIVAKMSKSLKNVVNPDDIIREFGADTFRVYEMYMGPLEASKPWNTKDIIGPFRFLQRLWRLALDEESGTPRVADAGPPPEIEKRLHRTIAGVTDDIAKLSLHTAIAKLIELNNELLKVPGAAPRRAVETLLLLLSPFAPHLCEELWSRLGHADSITRQPWPSFDPAMLVDHEVEIPVSVMGKLRSRVLVPTGADAKIIEAKALADPRIAELIAGKPIRKVIVVPGKMVNIVHG